MHKIIGYVPAQHPACCLLICASLPAHLCHSGSSGMIWVAGSSTGRLIGDFGIYKECITNISIDIYDITINIHKYIHQTQTHWGAAEGGACVSDYFIS